MKKIPYITLLIVSLLTMMACEKNLIEANNQWTVTNPENANVKFINAYTSNIPAGAPGVGATRFFIYQNTSKLNGNALSTAGAWPGPATYASLPTTSSNFFAILDRRVGNDYGKVAIGDTAFKGSVPLTAGKYFSVFLIGESPKQSIFSVEDKITVPAENTYAVRFANLTVSANAERALDIYSRRNAKVMATLKYKSVSEFVVLPTSTTSDTLDVREAGTTKNLYSFNNFIPVSKRNYTFYTYGRSTGGTAYAERILSYINR